MSSEFRTNDWDSYTTDPHWNSKERPEDERQEQQIVDQALAVLVDNGMLPEKNYDLSRFSAYRDLVMKQFDIPWTGVSPRMQRLIYAINAIHKPASMVSLGIFCGFTYSCSAGAAVGPGKCFEITHLTGIEINPEEADRARKNFAHLDPASKAHVVTADGRTWLQNSNDPIDLLYIDVTDYQGKSKTIYLEMLEAAMHLLHNNSLVLAHNSVNSAEKLEQYFNVVRDPQRFRNSVNMIIDGEGLEVTGGYRK